MQDYLTSGQVAKRLRISLSTLKRWLMESEVTIPERRNSHDWRLFTEKDVDVLKKYKNKLKKAGKRFNETTLIPVVAKQDEAASA
jgi:DNA-binding transcriptional MerR regulator